MSSWNTNEYPFLCLFLCASIYIPFKWWCKCLVIFPSKNRSHGQHSIPVYLFTIQAEAYLSQPPQKTKKKQKKRQGSPHTLGFHLGGNPGISPNPKDQFIPPPPLLSFRGTFTWNHLKKKIFLTQFVAVITFFPFFCANNYYTSLLLIVCALRWYIKSLYRHLFLVDISKHARVTPKKWHFVICGKDNSKAPWAKRLQICLWVAKALSCDTDESKFFSGEPHPRVMVLRRGGITEICRTPTQFLWSRLFSAP